VEVKQLEEAMDPFNLEYATRGNWWKGKMKITISQGNWWKGQMKITISQF